MKDKIMKWFKMGLWTEKMVQDAAAKNVLTEEEVNEILNGGAE